MRMFSAEQMHPQVFPSDERIQFLRKSCKMIQNLQVSCKTLAKYQNRQKSKSDTNVLANTFEANSYLLNKLQNIIDEKNFSPHSKSSKDLAR